MRPRESFSVARNIDDVDGFLCHRPSAPPASSPSQAPFGAEAQAKSVIANMLRKLRGEKLPAGIFKTNGRIEATQVNVSAKYAGRLSEVSVEEGSEVKQGQVMARISSPETEAQLKAAKYSLERAKETETEAEAMIASRTSIMGFAKADMERGQALLDKGFLTRQTFEERRRNFQTADANVQAAKSQRDQARAAIKSSEADVERIEAMLQDLVLVSPRDGRVQYQFARAGEVVGAGARIVTILDLKDVYMTIFVPAADAGKLGIGDEARIVLDPVPDYVIPATVSFVAADAQFTPKSVETKEEREKLMFRVKLKIDEPVLTRFYRKVKTGIRGIGVVRTIAATPWPEDLQPNLPK